MKNTLKVLCVLSAFAVVSACGDDDSSDDGKNNVDGGPPVKQMDAGRDSSTPAIDSSTPTPDSSTPNQPTVKVTMADFLNATSPSSVQTATKTGFTTVAGLIAADGTVQPL